MITFFPTSKIFVSFMIGSFNFSITYYAILIVSGAILAYLLSKHNLKQYHNIEINNFTSDCFVYVLWVGLIGARLWFCLFNDAEYYFSDFSRLIAIWDGGLGIHGGVLAGAIFMYFYCRKRNASFIKCADAILPTVMLAQGIGRWGNYINQECHGIEVDESYFDGILSFLKEGMHINGHYYEPMFFYESVLCILGFFIINYLLRKYQNKRGDLAYGYMMWYGTVRLFIEQRRTDSLMIFNIKTAQLISVVLIVVGLLGYLGLLEKLFKKEKPSIIFDFDGTLIDSEKAIIETYRELFRRHDKEENFTPERQIEILGPALRDIFPKYFPNESVDALFDEYQEIFHGQCSDYLKLMDNAELLLKTLKEKGYKVAIFSTRTKESGYKCLNKFSLGEYIDEYVGLNEVIKTKPDPEGLFKIINSNKWNSSDVIYVGDSSSDIEAGRNYGAYTIGYVFNEGKKEALEKANPNRIITNLSEILDILEEKHYFTYNLR